MDLKDINKLMDEIRDDSLEMSQLKSNFDMEKFSVGSQGPFLTVQFHFLMRQYSLTLSEVKRLTIEIETKRRQIKDLQIRQAFIDKDGYTQYPDLMIEDLKNQIQMSELSLNNKTLCCNHYEKIRQHLIKLNGGKFTNEQYQKEIPHFWKWKLLKKAVEQRTAIETGISPGLLENIKHLEADILMTEEFQFLGLIEEIKNGTSVNDSLEGENIRGIETTVSDQYIQVVS